MTSAFSDEELTWVLSMLGYAWAPWTLETYGAGVLLQNSHCNQWLSPVLETDRDPANEEYLFEFLTHYTGVYLGSTLKGCFYGICTWHVLHILPWNMNEAQMTAVLTTMDCLFSLSSK